MGVKPPAVGRAADPALAPSDSPASTHVRFTMAHALVLIAFVVTAAVLAELGTAVKDVLLLLGGAGGIGATVVLVVVTGGRSGGRFGRVLRAYLSSGN